MPVCCGRRNSTTCHARCSSKRATVIAHCAQSGQSEDLPRANAAPSKRYADADGFDPQNAAETRLERAKVGHRHRHLRRSMFRIPRFYTADRRPQRQRIASPDVEAISHFGLQILKLSLMLGRKPYICVTFGVTQQRHASRQSLSICRDSINCCSVLIPSTDFYVIAVNCHVSAYRFVPTARSDAMYATWPAWRKQKMRKEA